MNDSQSDNNKPLPHDYDGIQELNNPLPRWWLVTFYGTIVFAIFYWSYYELLGGPSSDEALTSKMAVIQKAKEKEEKKFASKSVELDAKVLLKNSAMMKKAKGEYAAKCLACHGAAGEGGIGPNLTDRFWIHSQGDMKGILSSIRTGFPAKGMPPWKDLIPADVQPYLAAHIFSLRGTSPPNAKAPQGEEIKN
ncbi:MAG: nitrogen fixation protein FixP [Bdellovibrionaceae bacterium]|nr:nitrogen fixation protein FixP [Pseudobdellovibrionaceae bacterium]|tara:strand:+ start:3492 stop:4070 length:579 start_codon:yes stop_codon:yes gene_type:complete